MNTNEEKLLAQILEVFSQTFGKKAVLRGGMALRILGSARYTNDLDYLFVPFKSKKEIVGMILNCLEQIPETTITHTLNSKCLRIIVENNECSVQIEAKVDLKVKTKAISNELIAHQHQLPVRVIPIVDNGISFANKLAAWNERRLVRDLYDIWFFIRLGAKPDSNTLLTRLSKPTYSRLVKKKDHFTGKTEREFYDFLIDQVSELSEQEVEDQLSRYIDPRELPGILLKIKTALLKL